MSSVFENVIEKIDNEPKIEIENISDAFSSVTVWYMPVIFGSNSYFTNLGLTDNYECIYTYAASGLNMMVNSES
jgi:hypothetical protein